jgi:hypothetical protein
MIQRIVVSAVCATLSFLAVVAAAEDGAVPAARGLEALTIGTRGPDGTGHRLHITLTSLDKPGATSGTASVVGFPVVLSGSFGDIDWQIDGDTVTGRLEDRGDGSAGTFRGTITQTGVSGTFTSADGRTGLWSWDGPLPATGSAARAAQPPAR